VAAKKSTNPFYVALMIAGTAFALTACAYGVMTVKMLDPTKLADDETTQFFVQFMDEHGVTIMLVELALLAVCTVAAIGTDGFWSHRDKQRREAQRDVRRRSVAGDSDAASESRREMEDAARSS
jgi:hypothetical protein